MDRIEPRLTQDENGKTVKHCGLDYCTGRKYYAKGYCKNHYLQLRRLGFVRPFIDYSKIEYGPCGYPDCKNKSTTKTGRQLCAGHINHIQPSHHAYREEPTEFRYYMNEGYTENGRVCKDCKVEKPLDEYYNRNQWKGPDAKVSKSTRCKDCYKKNVAYYAGRRETKADGTDPLGYKDKNA